ncbi:hypothetical protein [Streptomyces sp. NPDC051173]|uniref:hypothetical protein n=1 Tax=Streptomyces sp. NPDC051173 TaxID=3155164 RepID=UPI003450B2F0
MARTHLTLSATERQAPLAELAGRLGEAALGLRDRADAPTPGGVGYGVFYDTPFKTGFAQGTSLYWEVVCPTSPGGNVNTWLYLTAMNRAGKDLEAFVSYCSQDAPRFKVFDWARDDHWQIDIPWPSLGAYLMTRSAHGQNYQVLGVWNSTWQLAPGSWRNQALLWNQAAQRYDLIHQYDYAAADRRATVGRTNLNQRNRNRRSRPRSPTCGRNSRVKPPARHGTGKRNAPFSKARSKPRVRTGSVPLPKRSRPSPPCSANWPDWRRRSPEADHSQPLL